MDVVGLASEFPNDNPALHRGVIWVCLDPTGPLEALRSPSIASSAVSAVEALSSGASASAPFAVLGAETAADVDDETSIVVEELEPIEASVEGGGELAPPTVSEIVLVAARDEDRMDEVDAADGREPVTAGVTPAFEEIVATEVAPNESSALPPAPDDAFTVLVCTLADVAIGAGSPHVASILPGLFFDGRVPEPLDAATEAMLRSAGIWDGTQVATAFVATTLAWRAILRGTSDDFSGCGASMLDEWAADVLAKLLLAPTSALRQELRGRGVAAFGLVEVAA